MIKVLGRSSIFKLSTNVGWNRFPYKLGGLSSEDSHSINKSGVVRELLIRLFNKEIERNLKYAYKTYLEGLESKDDEFIKQVCEDNLSKDIAYKNVKLVNANSPIQVEYGNGKFIYGAGLDRKKHIKQWLLIPESLPQFKIFGVKDQMDSEGFHFLFSIQVYFRSKIKLIEESENTINENELTKQSEQKTENKQEIHMLQFQCENTLTIWQFIKISLSATKLIWAKKKTYSDLVRKFLGSEKCQWKIVDSDKSLNGNFPALSKKL